DSTYIRLAADSGGVEGAERRLRAVAAASAREEDAAAGAARGKVGTRDAEPTVHSDAFGGDVDRDDPRGRSVENGAAAADHVGDAANRRSRRVRGWCRQPPKRNYPLCCREIFEHGVARASVLKRAAG